MSTYTPLKLVPALGFRIDWQNLRLRIYVIQIPEEEVNRQITILEQTGVEHVLEISFDDVAKAIFHKLIKAVWEGLGLSKENFDMMMGRGRRHNSRRKNY